MFDIIQSVGAEATIKKRKNAELENIRGSKSVSEVACSATISAHL
ncbi:MAG: hypothetical protein QXU98_02400 [Candidatus Parvarchaeota archaeon]